MTIQAPKDTPDLSDRTMRKRGARLIASEPKADDAVAARTRIDSLGALEVGQPVKQAWNYYTRNSSIARKRQLEDWRIKYVDVVVELVSLSVSLGFLSAKDIGIDSMSRRHMKIQSLLDSVVRNRYLGTNRSHQ
jgi:hypothetical protein